MCFFLFLLFLSAVRMLRLMVITVLGKMELVLISVADGCSDDDAVWGCGGAEAEENDDDDDDNNGAKLTLFVLLS